MQGKLDKFVYFYVSCSILIKFSSLLILKTSIKQTLKWDKEFKNGPSKICEIRPLENLKYFKFLKAVFHKCFLNTLPQMNILFCCTPIANRSFFSLANHFAFLITMLNICCGPNGIIP